MFRAICRTKIRESIQPFPHTPRYPTGWDGDLTFEEIVDCLSPMMARKLARFAAITVRTSLTAFRLG